MKTFKWHTFSLNHLVCFIFLLCSTKFIQAQDGSIDLSFNTTDVGFGYGDGADGNINALALLPDGKILIGGAFTNYNGTARNRIARLNADGTLDATFNPGIGANAIVYSIALQPDGKVLIGGDFITYNGTSRNRVARLNADGVLDGTFNTGTGADGTVNTLALQPDGKILIGGSFINYNGTGRSRIARLNADGTVDATFNPGTGSNGTINSLAVQPDGKILIVGPFTVFNGTGRNRVARLNADGTVDATFNPGTGSNGTLFSLALQTDGKILVGGFFSDYNGTGRSCIARLNANGTLDVTFTPGTGANNTIYTFALQSDGKILVGGAFISYNGISINRIARLNATGTVDATFTPGSAANAIVYTLALQADGKSLAGGAFNNYDGRIKNRICRLNTDGLFDEVFNPGTGGNAIVYDAALQSDGNILIGGSFTSYNGTDRSRMARLNPDGTPDATFNPGNGANNVVTTLVQQPDGKIVIGGAFTTYQGAARNRIARVQADGTLDVSFNPGTGANSSILACKLQPDGKILIGGAFSTYNGTVANYITRINADGTLDATFNSGTGANATVYSLALQPDGKILVGGDFTTYNGTSRNRLVRLNADGTIDATFNSTGTGANFTVNAFAPQPDEKILIGGGFTTYNGISRIFIARLNSDGTLDASFNPGTGANGNVLSFVLQPDGKILIGGGFSTYNGTGRSRIARLNADGTLDLTFNPGTGTGTASDIRALILQPDQKIIIAGQFTSYNGTGRNRVARVNNTTTTLPLHLLNFFVSTIGAVNQLKWVTANEINTKEFIIERSADGHNFNRIAKVVASGDGNNHYSYNDNDVSFGYRNYYRLKMTDNDGRFAYSGIISSATKQNIHVGIYPSPASNEIILSVGNKFLLNTPAIINDIQGRQVKHFTIRNFHQPIDISNLSKGMYILILNDKTVFKISKN
jgi:uncharacterized delta-60 repeat protein